MQFDNVDTIKFENPAIIVGGGYVDMEYLSALLASGYRLIAADGGANKFYQTDIVPDLIVGDMDSLENIAHWHETTKVLELDDQNSTDFEKCLYSTSAPLYIGFGLIGKRFDHSLATMHGLARFGAEKTIMLVDEVDVILAARGPVKLSLPKGARISIYPFSKIEFESSKGLKYPLDGLVMEQGVKIGTSNEASSNPVEITPCDPDAIYKIIVAKVFLKKIIETVFQD